MLKGRLIDDAEPRVRPRGGEHAAQLPARRAGPAGADPVAWEALDYEGVDDALVRWGLEMAEDRYLDESGNTPRRDRRRPPT